MSDIKEKLVQMIWQLIQNAVSRTVYQAFYHRVNQNTFNQKKRKKKAYLTVFGLSGNKGFAFRPKKKY